MSAFFNWLGTNMANVGFVSAIAWLIGIILITFSIFGIVIAVRAMVKSIKSKRGVKSFKK